MKFSFKKMWKDISKGASSAVNAAEKAAKDAVNATEKAARDAAMATEKAARDVAMATEKAAKEVAMATEKAARDAVMAAEKAARDVEMATSVCNISSFEYAKQGFDVTTDAWKQGTDQVVKYASEGVEVIEYAAIEAYEWIDANACYIGLNLALTTGCVLYFTPKPSPADPGTVTSTAISTTYLGYIVVNGANLAMAIALGEIITNSILLIPGVKGKVDDKLLNRVITNTIATCNPVMLSVSLATPAGVGIFIGSVISPIVAQLVCDKTVPKGFTQAVS